MNSNLHLLRVPLYDFLYKSQIEHTQAWRIKEVPMAFLIPYSVHPKDGTYMSLEQTRTSWNAGFLFLELVPVHICPRLIPIGTNTKIQESGSMWENQVYHK